ncbi:MAG TPA: hypothetical protein VMH79_12140 [Thermoanaerobaculia bacterium]|nr:hypothetical protein [Thermoanaerobaculia bacterium]
MPTPPPYVIVDRKSPALAGFLSFFPGLGHLYLGLYPRAFAVGGAFILGIMMTSHGRSGEFFGPLVAFVWFFAVIDAVRQAKAINRGQLAESGFAGQAQLKRAASGTGGLTWGVILIGLGGLWLLNSYDLLDRVLDAIPEWGGPAAFILFGLLLVVSHIRKVRRENEAQTGMPPRSQ